MGSWPGAAADRWWASLPAARREQIHRWVQPEAREERLPADQLPLIEHPSEPDAPRDGR